MKRDVTLITGGGRSGKSDYAVAEAQRYPRRRVFIATAVAFDDEMAARIAAHRSQRGEAFRTVEAPLDLAGAIGSLSGDEVAVVDCLTVWLGNLMHHHGLGDGTQRAIDALLEGLAAPPCDVFVVTNEVGLGIIPDNAMARQFRDLAGSVNTRVARLAQRVVLLVAGIPLVIKGRV
ncbi:MAG: bifunctional adenosylcobinamide kinase/adenosylcobinamide-phosphate guanylyltransferase [Lentisphaerae bacterium]|nr:bifunctional adenosylcobinamide kinase/adenosylcobinamide-phosphate guanylyltransferase [Lentisphaerota bacterium]